jgi:hypothetical protein
MAGGTMAQVLQARALSLHEVEEKLTLRPVTGPTFFPESLAGLLRYPAYPQAEAEMQIEVEDTDEIVKGRIDVRILLNRLFAVVIESKNRQFTVDVALPQALTYMLDRAVREDPVYGLVTNSKHFQFIKVSRQGSPRYALSPKLSLASEGNGLYQVLQILQRLKAEVELRPAA